MLARVAAFELRYQLRNPVFWVGTALFFLFTFLSMVVDTVRIGGGGNTFVNAPSAIAFVHLIWSLFFMFVTTAFVSNVIVRDDESGFGPIVRSTRVSKASYLFGRFTGAYLAAALAFAAIPLAMWLGSLMPSIDPETLGPNRLWDYLAPYLIIGLPTIFATGAIFFALATVTRSMLATYLGVIVFLVIYFVTNTALGDRPEYERLGAWVEPFGISGYFLDNKYLTAAERNAPIDFFKGALLENRLIWIGVGIAALALAYALFRFSSAAAKKSGRREREEAVLAVPPAVPSGHLPVARGNPAWSQVAARARLEMRQIFRSPAYLVLLLIGLGLSLLALFGGGGTLAYGTEAFLVTPTVITLLQGAFGIVAFIIAVYYGGELVWRERDRRVHEIVDATPVPNWAYLVPKTIALALVLISTLIVGVVAGVLAQAIKGTTDFQLGRYFLWYVLPQSVDYLLLAILSIFVQALSPSKYVGWAVMGAYFAFNLLASSLGFEHHLYLYPSSPPEPLSDMNGAGSFWRGAWTFRLYWAGLALIMLVLAHLLWRRGTETRLKPRLARVPVRLKGTPGLLAALGAILFLSTGAAIYRNTNVLNEYRTEEDEKRFAADYEKRYLPYERLAQPQVTHVQLAVELHPERRAMRVQGAYRLVNRTAAPIADLVVRRGDRRTRFTRLDVDGARLVRNDAPFGFRVYRFDRPLAPGETRTLRFASERDNRGFVNSGPDTRLVENGTFINNGEFAPTVGMDRNAVLRDRTDRRKYGLPADLRPARLEDLSATRRNYIGADWTTADITVTTDAGQTPLAPGRKVADQVRGGRRTARFVSDAPILNFFSVQSARYAEKHLPHAGVDLAVYYHPKHDANVDRMLAALRSSLDYYQANFGPYQFDQARIIEFPGYAGFAQAFANTMPYSESIGFIADTRDPDKIDYVTYITAHEMAHQYWAHQVVGADMQGATLLSETLAQYSALMVMKKLYGEDKLRRFIKYELDSYLRSRGGDPVEELPLARVENQQYIHYRKGSVAMVLLQDRLGEAAVNRALARLAATWRFKGPPYPRSTDLIAELRREARSPADQALITDLFERIAIYDLKVDTPKATRRPDGRWDVIVPVVASKAYANGEGTETAAAMAEPLRVGLFTAEPGRGAFDARDVVMMTRSPVRSGRQVLRFITAERPTHAGVDPYNFHTDRNSDDNVAAVS